MIITCEVHRTKEEVVQQLPSKEILQNYGRSSKLLITAKDIPNLQFKLTETEGSGKVREDSENPIEDTGEVVEVIDSDVMTKTGSTVTRS